MRSPFRRNRAFPKSGFGHLVRLIAPVLLSLTLAGCMDDTGGRPNLTGGLDLSPRAGRSTAGAGGIGGSGSTEVVYFDDVGTRRVVEPGVQSVGEGYTVNLQGVSVEAAAKSLLADILQVPYTLDPAASGTITMATGGPVPRSELLMIFEEALHTNGLLLVSQGDGFQIRQDGGSSATASLKAEGYGLTALPLRHLGAQRMMTLLDGFAAPEGSIRASANDDMLIVRGTARDRASVAEMVSSLDVDLLARPNAGIAFLKNANAVSVQADLAALAGNDPQVSGWDTQVLERSNAILVQAHDRNDLARAMEWITRLDRSGGADGGDVHVYQVQFAKASDLATLLQATFGDGGGGASAPQVATNAPPPGNAPGGDEMAGAALPTGGAGTVQAVTASGGSDVRFTPNDGDNTIIIRAPEPIRRQAMSLLASIDKVPVQVLIDVLLIEVTLNDATKMGVQAYLEGSDTTFIASNGTGSTITPQFPGFNLILGSGINPKVIIDSLSEVTDVRVVSAPSIAAFENEEAEIKVVEQVPIVTQQVIGTQNPDAPVVNSVEYRDAGVILRVTPQVSQSNLVNLQVKQELSAVVGETTNGATLTPTLRQRSITTRVAVYDSQTVALGGLISSQTTGNKQSLFGFLGNHAAQDNNRTELVVFITPHVVRNQQDAAAISEELRRKMTLMAGQ